MTSMHDYEYPELTPKELRALRQTAAARNEQLEGGKTWRVLDFIILLGAILTFAIAIRFVIIEPIGVRGPSMLPTLEDGDYMIVEKISYLFRTPERGELIIVYYPNNDVYTCVKRVIGLPGETVTIQGGYVYINGTLLDEPYIAVERTGVHDNAWVVPDGQIFVLGDNRNESRDSTSSDVGCISESRIVGRVWCVLWPVSRARGF